ncbi:MAG: adenylate/guanylate cyclase domain-containing protein [Granulosicoccaceae bacterium]
MHAMLATLYLGFNAGFWLLVFISVAFIPLYPLLSRPVRVLIGIALAVGIGMVALIAIQNGSIYTVSNNLSSLFLLMNLVVLALIIIVIIVSYDLAVERAEQAQQVEYDRAESLLLNVLPARITARLKSHEEPLADSHDDVSVLFADIAGFTNLSRNLSARDLVSLLNDLFTRFDANVEIFGAEKIKTIGDAYMVATGLRGEIDHATKIVDLAIAIQHGFNEFREENDLDLKLRIGIHSGAVVAGVIGKQKFAYDLWGNTVNVASRMESEGVADRIQISAETRALLPIRFKTQARGEIQIKGHRARECFLLES